MRASLARTLRIVVSIVALALGTDGQRSVRAAGDTPPPRTRSAPFEVDIEASRVYVKVGAAGRLGHEHGVEGRLASGKVEMGGAGELVFDMRSFVADLPDARGHVNLKGTVSNSDQKKITSTMLGASVLDVAHHPKATYKIASVVPVEGQAPGEPGGYRLEGEFTLHGVTSRLSVPATVERTTTPGRFRLRGSFAIEQSRFGITPYSTLGGLASVLDRLEIAGDIVLRSSVREARDAPPTGR
jgi:polyisoprenoid-binding protein YceI